MRAQKTMGAMADGESDEFKRILLEGNPVLLAVTFAVSLLHSVFDVLAFKNDIGFWKNKKNVEGLSVRTILINCFCQVCPRPVTSQRCFSCDIRDTSRGVVLFSHTIECLFLTCCAQACLSVAPITLLSLMPLLSCQPFWWASAPHGRADDMGQVKCTMAKRAVRAPVCHLPVPHGQRHELRGAAQQRRGPPDRAVEGH